MHIGNTIKEIFDKQSKPRTISWFAKQLECDRRNVYSIFARGSISTELLCKISRILDHDFFIDISNDMKESEMENMRRS